MISEGGHKSRDTRILREPTLYVCTTFLLHMAFWFQQNGICHHINVVNLNFIHFSSFVGIYFANLF